MSERAQGDERIRARLPELQPLTGDFGAPEDVAGAALYLAYRRVRDRRRADRRRWLDGAMTCTSASTSAARRSRAIVLERDGESYREVCDRVVETRRDEPPAGIVAQLGEFGGELAHEAGGIDTAGATIPGTFDLETGVAHFVTNLGAGDVGGRARARPAAAARSACRPR